MAPYSDDIQSPGLGPRLSFQRRRRDRLPEGRASLWDAAAKAGVSVQELTASMLSTTRSSVPGCTATSSTPEHQYPDHRLDSAEAAIRPGASSTPTRKPTRPATRTPAPVLQQHSAPTPRSPISSRQHRTRTIRSLIWTFPDQYRVDIWKQQFDKDLVKAGNVPQLEMMWISSDHTGGQIGGTNSAVVAPHRRTGR